MWLLKKSIARSFVLLFTHTHTHKVALNFYNFEPIKLFPNQKMTLPLLKSNKNLYNFIL